MTRCGCATGLGDAGRRHSSRPIAAVQTSLTLTREGHAPIAPNQSASRGSNSIQEGVDSNLERPAVELRHDAQKSADFAEHRGYYRSQRSE